MSDPEIYETAARFAEEVAAHPGVYVGPQSYSFQPSKGMSQLPADIPRGPMGPNIKGSVKDKPRPDLPKGPIQSNVKGSSSSKPPVQTRSISGPPIHGGPAPNSYYPSPTRGYHPPPPHPGNYPPPAPQNSQIPANYPYAPVSYGGYVAQGPYAPGPGGPPLPPQGGHVGGFYPQGVHAPPPPFPPSGGGYYGPTGGDAQAPAGNYSPPTSNYPPSGGYPSHVYAPPMTSNLTSSGEFVQGIGGFATRPRLDRSLPDTSDYCSSPASSAPSEPCAQSPSSPQPQSPDLPSAQIPSAQLSPSEGPSKASLPQIQSSGIFPPDTAPPFLTYPVESIVIGNDQRNSQNFDTLNVWIGAEHALQHLNRCQIEITREFSKHNIESSQYAIYAGFDESLLRGGIGYLEQIHVFTSASVPATSPLLSSLGKIFSPFSSILFTQSSKYCLPVYKLDGSRWEFDELVFETAAKFVDRGTTAAMCPTVISHSQTTEASLSSTGLSAQSVKAEKGKDPKGKGRDIGRNDEDEGKDEEENGDRPGGDPDGPPNNASESRPAQPTSVSFKVVSKIYPATPQDFPKQVFQFLTVQGTLTIHDAPPSTTGVQFTKLKFGSIPSTNTAYQQYHLRIMVDSRCKDNDVIVHKPQRTPASDRENKVVSGTNTNSTFGGSVGATLGYPIQSSHVTLAGTAARSTEHSTGVERKDYTSRIAQQELWGAVWWGFDVDDPHERQGGINLSEETLPSMTFEFPHSTSSANLSKPRCVDVEVSSYWSIIPQHTYNLGWNRWIKSLFSDGTSDDVPLAYSNLCQIVVLSIPRRLTQSSSYKATVGVTNQPQTLQSTVEAVEKTGEVEVFTTLTRRISDTPIEYGNVMRECSLELRSIRLACPESVMTAQPQTREEKDGASSEALQREIVLPPIPLSNKNLSPEGTSE